MELSNTHQSQSHKITIDMPEEQYLKLKLLQREDGIPPSVRLRQICKNLVKNDQIRTYNG